MTAISNKKFTVFSEGPVAIGSLIHSLLGSFSNTAIMRAQSADIKHRAQTLDQNTLAFVLPGITGEHSPFLSLLGREGNYRIRRYVEEGGVFIGFCAGAYYACEDIAYHTPWGLSKSQKPGLDFFRATAKGPQIHLGRQSLADDRWSDVMLTKIQYNDGSNKSRTAHICYGNGPALTRIRDDDVTAIAHYEDVPGNPVAVASRRIGKGLALFVGVHPEIRPLDIRNDSTSGNLDHAKNLGARLLRHEPQRQAFWNHLMQIVLKHNIELGRAAPSLLKRQP